MNQNNHVAVEAERVIFDPWKEPNTDLLTLSQTSQVFQLTNKACAEQGLLVGSTPRDSLSQHKLYAYIQKQLIRLLYRNGITTLSGRGYVSLPPFFTQNPEQFFWEQRVKLLGWPRGLSKYFVSHWPVHQGFVMAYLFIEKRIDAMPINCIQWIHADITRMLNDDPLVANSSMERTNSKQCRKEVKKVIKKKMRKHETAAMQSAREWIKKVKEEVREAETPSERAERHRKEKEIKKNAKADAKRRVIPSSPVDQTTVKPVAPQAKISSKPLTKSAPAHQSRVLASSSTSNINTKKPTTSTSPTTPNHATQKVLEKAAKEAVIHAFKAHRRSIETPAERAERHRLKALKKEAKQRETPQQRLERRRKKKDMKKAAKKEAKKKGIAYVPPAYSSAAHQVGGVPSIGTVTSSASAANVRR